MIEANTLQALINGLTLFARSDKNISFDPKMLEPAPTNGSDTVIIDGGIAIIPIKGTIGYKLTNAEKDYGCCDLVELDEAINYAIQEDVAAIVFDIDSPGGVVTHVPESADLISKASAVVPTWAVVNDMCASAAYYLASGCDTIYAAESLAMTGSIGVYLPIMDISKLYEKLGLKADLIISNNTPYKATGYPGTSLTDDQRANLQEGVDEIYKNFTDHVLSHRKVDPKGLMGQVEYADKALEYNLIDGVATLEETVAEARKYIRKHI
jgi:signal peptide peptidase SppA